MLSLKDITPVLLEKWDENTDILVVSIANDMTILDYSQSFEKYAQLFSSIEDLITFTHKSQFLSNLSKCIEAQSVLSFVTNFYYEKDNIEDIPQTFKLTMQYIKENEIVIVAEPLPALSHNDAKAYFSMISEYSTISRKLQKSEYELNILNIDLKKQIKEIEYYANYDTLTNVYNRRRIFEELNKEYQKYKRFHRTFSVAMIDIDDFKNVNDTYGHQSGDIVLSELSSVLKSMLRVYDTLGRFGGEEFLILLPETNSDMAKLSIQRMLKEVTNHNIKIVDEQSVSITFSAGVSEIAENMTLNDAIAQADEKLYQAKEDGKNRVY